MVAWQERHFRDYPFLERHRRNTTARSPFAFTRSSRPCGTSVRLGLKCWTNREAAERNHRECGDEVIGVLNVEIVRARAGHPVPRERALELARRVLATGGREDAVAPEDLLRVPAFDFFRRRGEHADQPADVSGALVGRRADDVRSLRNALPEAYVAGRDFAEYLAGREGRLPFYG